MTARRKEPTLHDVAELAGVHYATVSRALSSDRTDLVAAETLARVQAAAKELNYRPNTMARGLKTRRSCTIGVLIPDLTNPLFPPIVRGIEDVLADEGYTPLIVNTDDDPQRGAAAFTTLLERQVDGILTATEMRGGAMVREARRNRAPLVLVMQGTDAKGVWAVCPDEQAVMREAVAHLAELGHRRIAHVAGPQDNWNGYERRQGFLAAMADAGLKVQKRLIVEASRFTLAEGAAACDELLGREREFTALIAGNDLIALGCIDALQGRRLRCPRDVSVVGVNDMPLADRLDPPLTTVRLPQREMGAEAARMMLERIAKPSGRARRKLLAPSLVVRRSTAAPRG